MRFIPAGVRNRISVVGLGTALIFFLLSWIGVWGWLKKIQGENWRFLFSRGHAFFPFRLIFLTSLKMVVTKKELLFFVLETFVPRFIFNIKVKSLISTLQRWSAHSCCLSHLDKMLFFFGSFLVVFEFHWLSSFVKLLILEKEVIAKLFLNFQCPDRWTNIKYKLRHYVISNFEINNEFSKVMFRWKLKIISHWAYP